MYGIYVVNENHGLIPISRQRRAIVANCIHAINIVGITAMTIPRTVPNADPVAINSAPLKIVKNTIRVEIHSTPQYSLRVDLPLKERY